MYLVKWIFYRFKREGGARKCRGKPANRTSPSQWAVSVISTFTTPTTPGNGIGRSFQRREDLGVISRTVDARCAPVGLVQFEEVNFEQDPGMSVNYPKFIMETPIKKIKSDVKGNYFLEWTDEERKELEEKILNLQDNQLAALACLMVGFSKENVEDVVKDIKENKQQSGHLCILIDEAKSKEELLWWVDYFTKANKK